MGNHALALRNYAHSRNNMQIWNSIEEAGRAIAGAHAYSAVTIGNFDGVHRGHQAIIQRIAALSREYRLLSVVLTFATHTGNLLGKQPPLINPPDLRRELLKHQGLDAVLEVRFDEQLAKLRPERFFQEWLVERLRVKNMVIGHDFKFGAGGAGNYHLLNNLAKSQSIHIEQIPVVLSSGGTAISSSKIRHLIRHGHMEQANEMLGYPFTMIGEVVEGEQRGRSLGFPTANICPAPEYLLPAYGVYLVNFTVEEKKYSGIASVGVKPTFGIHDPLIEVHLFDVSLDLYHKTARVEFVKFIRPEVRFRNAADLKKQIAKDIETARETIVTGDLLKN